VTLADERARQQENTNFDLNRRASLRPYLWEREAGDRLPRPGAQGAIPWAYSASKQSCKLAVGNVKFPGSAVRMASLADRLLILFFARTLS